MARLSSTRTLVIPHLATEITPTLMKPLPHCLSHAHLFFDGSNNRNGETHSRRTANAPDSVDVVLFVVGESNVDNEGDASNVDSSSSNVCADEESHLAVLEGWGEQREGEKKKGEGECREREENLRTFSKYVREKRERQTILNTLKARRLSFLS